MPRSTLSRIVLSLTVAALAGCAAEGEFAPGEMHYHGPPIDEVDQIHQAVTCAASIDVYPIAGPHNGGWDSNATTFTCNHPAGAGDNSDFIAGDHFGNDLFAEEGTPAVAPVTGVITHSGYGTVSGNRVTIMDDCGWHYFSGHLETIAPGMSVGTNVTAGQVIGTVGDTGNAAGTQAHIHFSVYPESYNAGIDPFPLLEAADHNNCDGSVSGGGGSGSGSGSTSGGGSGSGSSGSGTSGAGTDPLFNPCTDEDIVAAEDSGAFNFLYGGDGARTETAAPASPDLPETGGLDDTFRAVESYAGGADFTVGRWGPYVSHTGKWMVEAFIPDTATELANVVYEVAYQGGRFAAEIDQEANKGQWVELLPQAVKVMEGVASYVGLTNATMPGARSGGGAVAYDSVRWVFIGNTGTTGAGGGCQLSTDCMGNLICGQSNTCESPCSAGTCSTGLCDVTTGVCSLPSEGDPLEEPVLDTDGDGIPNYLEGPDDADGDGIPNWFDNDSDNDGISDAVEGSGDADGDGVLDAQDTDSDNDGIPDSVEVGDYEDMPLDSDLDGIPDFQDSDSDNDGIPDAVEVGHPEEPYDTDNDGTPDYLDTDSDNDGATDGEEAGYEPTQPTDSDEDGVPDYMESGDAADDPDVQGGTGGSSNGGGNGFGGGGGFGSDSFGADDGTDWSKYSCSTGATEPAGGALLLVLLALVGMRPRRRS